MQIHKIRSIWGVLVFSLLIWSHQPACAQDDFSLSDTALEEPGGDSTDPAGETTEPGGESPAEAPAGNSSGVTGSLIDPSLDEAEQTEVLANNFKFKPPKQKDPFKPLVQKKVILPPVVRPRVRPTGPSAAPPPPPPPPIQLFVSGIVGNDGERLAIVNFENKIKTIHKDEVIDGKFKVVDILPDRIVIYSNKEQMRRTFSIGGAGKN